jgi:hypothetical protein
MIVLDFDSLDGEQSARARSRLGRALLDELCALSRRFCTLTIGGAAVGGGLLPPEFAVEASGVERARLLVEQATLLWIAVGERGDPLALAEAPVELLGPAATLARDAVRRARALALDAEAPGAERVRLASAPAPEDSHDDEGALSGGPLPEHSVEEPSAATAMGAAW